MGTASVLDGQGIIGKQKGIKESAVAAEKKSKAESKRYVEIRTRIYRKLSACNFLFYKASAYILKSESGAWELCTITPEINGEKGGEVAVYIIKKEGKNHA